MKETINALQDATISEFSLFDDWTGKYEYLIDLGKQLPLIKPEFKTDAYRIKGCQSQVWLNSEIKDGRIVFTADSDAIITKGLIALLVRILSNQKPEDVANAELYFVDRIGLREHLSPSRSNGLAHMIDKMKSSASALQNV
jgi:cysteine desulfuration protein SufE